MVGPDDFEEVVLTRHVKHDKPVNNQRVKSVVEDVGGPVYKDKQKQGYHLLDGSTSIVFVLKGSKAVVVTAYPNFRRDYNHSSRFSRIG